jgi:3-hydroxyisobutyrate dehydrogenase-like beta-hydroxyacid dehydrogenase
MGSALALALVRANLRVTVWNRTRERTQPLLDLGAVGTETIAEAVRASPLLLTCIDSYGTARRILGAPEVTPHLAGRILIQLSTGTPKEAREAETWAGGFGAHYIDGKLLCGPDAIGTDAAMILFAGSTAAYSSCESALKSLGGDIRYLGTDIGTPAALDMAWLTACFGGFIGAAHGARLCEAEGVGIDLFVSTLADKDNASWLANAIHTKAFENPSATLLVWNEALRRIQDQANDAGVNCEFPDFMAGILRRAIEAGHGGEHIAAMYKVLKGR